MLIIYKLLTPRMKVIEVYEENTKLSEWEETANLLIDLHKQLNPEIELGRLRAYTIANYCLYFIGEIIVAKDVMPKTVLMQLRKMQKEN